MIKRKNSKKRNVSSSCSVHILVIFHRKDLKIAPKDAEWSVDSEYGRLKNDMNRKNLKIDDVFEKVIMTCEKEIFW